MTGSPVSIWPISPRSSRRPTPKIGDTLKICQDNPTRRKFLTRLWEQVSKRGTIDVVTWEMYQFETGLGAYPVEGAGGQR